MYQERNRPGRSSCGPTDWAFCDELMIMTSTDVEAIINFVNINKPDVVIIDSIQTMNPVASQFFPGKRSANKGNPPTPLCTR